jgi:hypothetical protein
MVMIEDEGAGPAPDNLKVVGVDLHQWSIGTTVLNIHFSLKTTEAR